MDYIEPVIGDFIFFQWRYVEIFYNEFQPNQLQNI
jgi:hypothetical protein